MSLFGRKNDPISNAEKAEGDMKKNPSGSLAPNKPEGDTALLLAFFRTLLDI
jgi:hypothetical protein